MTPERSSASLTLTVELPAEAVEEIARRAAELAAELADHDRSPWLNVDEAAEYTGIPKQSLYKLTAAESIPFSKPGSRIIFNRSDLDWWLEQHKEGPSAPTRPSLALVAEEDSPAYARPTTKRPGGA